MSLGYKAALAFILMLAVGLLMIVARRRNYDRLRRLYTTRRDRVPIEKDQAGPRPGGGSAP